MLRFLDSYCFEQSLGFILVAWLWSSFENIKSELNTNFNYEFRVGHTEILIVLVLRSMGVTSTYTVLLKKYM
jgi:hypothetical protein